MAPTWGPQGILNAIGRGWRGGRGWLGVAGGGRATPSHLRPTPPSGHPRQSRPLPLRIPCGSQVVVVSPFEKLGALERKAEGPFRPVARSSAATSAWTLAALSLGDAARRARPLQLVKRPMALLPDGGLKTAARWSKKRRRRSHRRGRLATPRGVTERERRQSPGRRRRSSSRPF